MNQSHTAVKLLAIVLLSLSCNTPKKKPIEHKSSLVNESLEHAEAQLRLLVEVSDKSNRIPRTVKNNKMHWTNQSFDWTEGFFPGTCWYLYDNTKDKYWKRAAEKFQAQFEAHKYKTDNHDLGFIFNCSYGNAYKFTKEDKYKHVLITAANSLITRFNPAIGAIKSWDTDKGWQSKRDWMFPVIIDNMMNLELLFKASELTGNPKYKNVAINHANTTLTNHFRRNFSSYHVVDYDPDTGSVRYKQTAQGSSDNSSWARGQAWGLYGFTVCYRYTKDKTYLHQAEQIAKYILKYPDTPEDGIPYWDYNAPNIPNEPRDVSAATITFSALIELDAYSKNNYKPAIDKFLEVLSDENYLSRVGDNHYFLLKHAVGSIPHNTEIDVPLNYADYYFVEALLRLKKGELFYKN